MKLKVTEQGVLIPKELLGDSQEVEVIQEEEKLVMKIKKEKKQLTKKHQRLKKRRSLK